MVKLAMRFQNYSLAACNDFVDAMILSIFVVFLQKLLLYPGCIYRWDFNVASRPRLSHVGLIHANLWSIAGLNVDFEPHCQNLKI